MIKIIKSARTKLCIFRRAGVNQAWQIAEMLQFGRYNNSENLSAGVYIMHCRST